jgi:tungstate transport system substrate-binding protein
VWNESVRSTAQEITARCRLGAVALMLALLAACAPVTATSPPENGRPDASQAGAEPASLAGGPATREVILATTTSTYDTGLLDALHPLFERATGFQVKTISVGTGQALALGARGEADVVLVHAPEAERQWIAEGHGAGRLLVMYNDFVLVGPANDPAGVRGLDVAGALRRVAAAHATWVSRGDNSGTHLLERQLWQAAEINPDGSAWYLSVGQGMGQTLNVASDRQAYTLADRGTWLARRGTLDLPILVDGDARLLNLYHVLPVNPAKGPQINAPGGQAYASWLVGPEAQAAIGQLALDRYGQPLFVPAAGRTEAELQGR